MKGNYGDIGILIVIGLISVYFFISLKYLRYMNNHLGSVALFERSEYILILANTANYFEALFNMFCGYYNDINNYYTILPAVYAARLYAVCLGLRSYRIIMLDYYRKGELLKDTLTKRSSLKFIIMFSNIYAILLLIPIIIILLLGIESDFFSYYIWFAYSFESLAFLTMSYKIFEANTHPTIVIEYLFYSMIWATGISTFNMNIKIRYLYEIPIRNLALLFISINSISEHSENTRPPLPLDIAIINLFEIEELYYDFKRFVFEKENNEILEACEKDKELIQGKFNHDFKNLYSLASRLESLKTSINIQAESSFDVIEEGLECKLPGIVDAYIYSAQHRDFRKEYFINFT